MSYQPQFPGFFTSDQGAVPAHHHDDSHTLAATPKQMQYATALAAKTGTPLPKGIGADRVALSAWIDGHKPKPVEGRFANYPSSKQVAFAERIARVKRREVPRECFHDKTMMSRWIDGNKPR
ncbi:hypothetical protein [Sulfitobacter sp. CW3]|uniref:hypothetical protein n=1 Tax=Sulfitobacter sp. CW3 TaxID=2861965 RepID=UPI001C602D7D|nr:hypothetical protein [Sulfitobacter sp. CW3]MBW4961248.1 hypothetical protein [Sulfitobacter sp. CW3]